MSITPQKNFSSDRMRSRTKSTLISLAKEYESEANDTPSVAYDNAFWNGLQRTLQAHAQKKCRIAEAGSYTELAAYLRDLEQYGIPLAVGRARHRVENENPRIIATSELWDDLYEDIEEFDTNTDIVAP